MTHYLMPHVSNDPTRYIDLIHCRSAGQRYIRVARARLSCATRTTV